MPLIWLSAQLFRHLLEPVRAFPPVHLFSLLSESSGCPNTAVDEEDTLFTLSPEAHMKPPCSVWQQKVPIPSQRPSETKSSNTCISYSSQKFFRSRQWMQGDSSVAASQGRESPWPSCVCTSWRSQLPWEYSVLQVTKLWNMHRNGKHAKNICSKMILARGKWVTSRYYHTTLCTSWAFYYC